VWEGQADKAQRAYKQRVRQLTRRIGGKGMAEVAHKLKQYVNGRKAYFKLADTPRVWRELDEWMRHRLRAIQLKQWKRGSTMYRELTKLGAPQGVAERVAGNSRCWWRNSDGLIKTVLTIQYFDKAWSTTSGMNLNLTNRLVRTRMLGGVAGAQSC